MNVDPAVYFTCLSPSLCLLMAHLRNFYKAVPHKENLLGLPLLSFFFFYQPVDCVFVPTNGAVQLVDLDRCRSKPQHTQEKDELHMQKRGPRTMTLSTGVRMGLPSTNWAIPLCSLLISIEI